MRVPAKMPAMGPPPIAACKISLARPTINDLRSLPINAIVKKMNPIPSRISKMPSKGAGNTWVIVLNTVTRGLVAIFTTLKSFMLIDPRPASEFAKNNPILSKGWKKISSGRKITTLSKLKKSWIVAAANAFLNSVLLPT